MSCALCLSLLLDKAVSLMCVCMYGNTTSLKEFDGLTAYTVDI